VAHDAIVRMNAAVIPAFGVEAIYAEDLQVAGVDFGREGADHAVVFEFEEAAAGRGKDEDGQASVAEGKQFHVAVNPMAVPIVIIAAHNVSLS
jgi:hypothetical protein